MWEWVRTEQSLCSFLLSPTCPPWLWCFSDPELHIPDKNKWNVHLGKVGKVISGSSVLCCFKWIWFSSLNTFPLAAMFSCWVSQLWALGEARVSWHLCDHQPSSTVWRSISCCLPTFPAPWTLFCSKWKKTLPEFKPAFQSSARCRPKAASPREGMEWCKLCRMDCSNSSSTAGTQQQEAPQIVLLR